ncbi:unnamed protein product [Cylindrotheca closterium]|uniref:Uncharacterized protein n=1 Tax=Cylindrotheca closterium TaxID=2856 RepID=A0AAD2CNJ6_9STRA|nr:unnamed protein product [Cylindrotheca closterium]
MVSSSTMHNFPSPWRINHAGEVVRDVNAEESLQKVSPERDSFFGSDADAKKNNMKGKKESWFRIVPKKSDKNGDDSSNFQAIENMLDNMQCFSCGPMGENTGDGKKKTRFLPTLTILSKKGVKTTRDDKSKKEKVKKKEEAAASKDLQKGPTKDEHRAKWFHKKKHEDDPKSTSYDIWAAVMPSPITEAGDEQKKKKEKQSKKSKLQWFRLSSKSKKGEKVPTEEKAKEFDLTALSSMITALVNREAEQQSENNKGESSKAMTEQAGSEKATATEISHDTDSNLTQWYERLKSEGEGYIRFVTGSDPVAEEDSQAPRTATDTKDTLKQDDASLDGTIRSHGSDSTSTWVTEFSSYEVPSLLQELKLLTSFHSTKSRTRHAKASMTPQEDEKFLLRKIANDPSVRRNSCCGKDNTLTLQTLGKEGTRDHGFKVKIHEDRALCEV